MLKEKKSPFLWLLFEPLHHINLLNHEAANHEADFQVNESCPGNLNQPLKLTGGHDLMEAQDPYSKAGRFKVGHRDQLSVCRDML